MPVPPATSEPEWLTIPEIARRLRVSPMTAYRLGERGELVTHRIGKQIRVKATDLAAYIQTARQEVAP